MRKLQVFTDKRQAGECRSCHAPTVWFTTVKNQKPIQINVPASGEIAYLEQYRDPLTGKPIAVIDTDVHPPHFATCPQAKTWRKK